MPGRIQGGGCGRTFAPRDGFGGVRVATLRFQNNFSIALLGKKTLVQNRKTIYLKKMLFLNRGVFVPK